jgi:hydroxylamine reductase
MIGEMFCFQCEQTAGCKGCTGKAGVCGKTSAVSLLQDELTGALIGYAASMDGNAPVESDAVVMRALFSTLTNVDFDEEDLRSQISVVKGLCPSAETYQMAAIWSADEDVRSLKSLVLFGLRGLAAYAYHAMVLGQTDPSIPSTIYN